MLKKSLLISLFMCLFVMTACEKQIDDGTNTDDTETPVDPGDDGGGDDDGGDDGGAGGSDDGGGSGGSDEGGGSGGSGGSEGGDSGSGGSGSISTGDVVSVQQFLTLSNLPMVYVEGYVVGACSGALSNAEFTPTFTKSTSILLADDVEETDVTKVVPVKRPTSKNVGVDLNLVTNPSLWHKKIQIPGYQETYYGTIGIQDVLGLCNIVNE